MISPLDVMIESPRPRSPGWPTGDARGRAVAVATAPATEMWGSDGQGVQATPLLSSTS